MRPAIGALLSMVVAMGGGYFVSLNVAQGDEVVNSSAETKSQGHWCDSVDLQNCDFAKELVGKTVVCVGDSWAAGTVTDGVLSSTSDETSWWWHLGRDLSLENVIHKGVGGAGWARHGGIAPGQNFNDELTMLAEAMTPEERSGVGLIIIAGGINDVVSNQTAEGVLRGVGDCLDTCDRFFPDAEVHLFPMPWPAGVPYVDKAAVLESSVVGFAGLRGGSVTAHEGCHQWLGGNLMWRGDAMHPNPVGMRAFARAMADELMNGRG